MNQRYDGLTPASEVVSVLSLSRRTNEHSSGSARCRRSISFSALSEPKDE